MTPADFASLRRAMGHTQHSLAVALRMGKHGWQTISGWENGKAPIPGPVALAMEHLAHCKPLEQNAVQRARALIARATGEQP